MEKPIPENYGYVTPDIYNGEISGFPDIESEQKYNSDTEKYEDMISFLSMYNWMMVEFDRTKNVVGIRPNYCAYQELIPVSVMGKVRDFADNYIKDYINDDIIEMINEAQFLASDDGKEYVKSLEAKRIKAEKAAAKDLKLKEVITIYVLFDKANDFYKIGKTKNIKKRIGQIKTGNPNVEIFAHYKGCGMDEIFFHKKFNDKRVAGEWFRLDSQDLKYINSYYIPF